MKLYVALGLALGMVVPAFVMAQQTTAPQTSGPQLTAVQTEGRNTFARSCSICHLTPQYNAPTYGPKLNQGSLGGNESVLREVISNGTPRMPAFKHMYNAEQIGSIIAYLKTVPVPPPAPTPASQTR